MNAYVGNEPFVFVSYAHSDKQIAESVIIGLKQKMCRVFYDDGLTPGEPWNDELAEKVIKCECLVVLLTNNSASSKYVRTELNFAIAKDKTIIPVMFGKTKLPPGIEMMLSPYQFIIVDPIKEKNYLENLLEKLINALPTNVFSTNKAHMYRGEARRQESDNKSIRSGQQRKGLYGEKNRKWLKIYVLAIGIIILCDYCLQKFPSKDDPIAIVVILLFGLSCCVALFIPPIALAPLEPDGTWQWQDKPDKHYVKVEDKKYAPRRVYYRWLVKFMTILTVHMVVFLYIMCSILPVLFQ